MFSQRMDFCSAVSLDCEGSRTNLQMDRGQALIHRVPTSRRRLLFVLAEINGEFTQRVGHRRSLEGCKWVHGSLPP